MSPHVKELPEIQVTQYLLTKFHGLVIAQESEKELLATKTEMKKSQRNSLVEETDGSSSSSGAGKEKEKEKEKGKGKEKEDELGEDDWVVFGEGGTPPLSLFDLFF